LFAVASCYTPVTSQTNLTDRIFFVVHLALTVLVCARYSTVPHWPRYVAWNLTAMAAILVFARRQRAGWLWEFVHDWLPFVFFFTLFEEVSFLSLALRGDWQNPYLIAWESLLFAVPPAEWLHRFSSPWFSELLEFGYLSFYPLYPAVAGLLWLGRRQPSYAEGFRHLTDGLSVGYAVCYATYLLFPTRSPSHNAAQDGSVAVTHSVGPFHSLVGWLQTNAGVHGNAFPSAHIMLAFTVLVFVVRYFPRLAPWVLICVLLMCAGAVYDGYHYAVDVIGGAMIGLAAGVAFLGRKRMAVCN
jgi:membrane-associated phospholipid phosphatase